MWTLLTDSGSLPAHVKKREKYSHDPRNIADRHGSIVSPALSLIILATVRVLAGRRVVRHFDRRAAGFLTLSQLPQLLGQSRQVLEEKTEKRHEGRKITADNSSFKDLWSHLHPCNQCKHHSFYIFWSKQSGGVCTACVKWYYIPFHHH